MAAKMQFWMSKTCLLYAYFYVQYANLRLYVSVNDEEIEYIVFVLNRLK